MVNSKLYPTLTCFQFSSFKFHFFPSQSFFIHFQCSHSVQSTASSPNDTILESEKIQKLTARLDRTRRKNKLKQFTVKRTETKKKNLKHQILNWKRPLTLVSLWYPLSTKTWEREYQPKREICMPGYIWHLDIH